MSRDQVCQYLGITITGLMLLRRDRLIHPDCAACGRYRYLRTDIERDSLMLMKHLTETYKDSLNELLSPDIPVVLPIK
jgi:hypothetical protein